MNKRKSTTIISMLLVMVVIGIKDISAQAIELNGFYGWQLAGKVRLNDGDFILKSAPNYGGKLAIGLSSTTFVELSYMRSETEGRFRPFNISEDPGDVVRLSSNYIQIGGLQEANLGRIRPFGTLAVGTVIWAPEEYDGNKWQFSVTLGGGIKIWLTDFLGIRVQGSMMMPMVWNGVGFGCGIGTWGADCGGGVYTRVTPFQGEFSGGLILRIGPN